MGNSKIVSCCKISAAFERLKYKKCDQKWMINHRNINIFDFSKKLKFSSFNDFPLNCCSYCFHLDLSFIQYWFRTLKNRFCMSKNKNRKYFKISTTLPWGLESVRYSHFQTCGTCFRQTKARWGAKHSPPTPNAPKQNYCDNNAPSKQDTF